MKKLGFIVILITLLVSVTGVQAQVGEPPALLTYQGHLLDAAGAPVADGEYAFTFSLWDAPTEGVQLWGPEAHSVTVTDGYFAVLLGEQAPLPVLDTQHVYLELSVDGETLNPRQRLASVAFALNAGTLAGQTPDYYRDWDTQINVPGGFADGVDNDTVYTDADAVAAIAVSYTHLTLPTKRIV